MSTPQADDRLPPPPDRGAVDSLRAIATSHLSDAMGRLFGMRGLRRYNTTGKLLGTAFTVKTRPGDNVMIYKALTLLSPGHVLVVDGGGDLNNALVGELMMLYARARGCAGFVIEGAVRDVSAFASFPCYARGNVHMGPYKSGPGFLNVPVAIGGQVVMPGDYLVGDEDGLLVLAPDRVDDVAHRARQLIEKEDGIRAEIATERAEQTWIAQIMRDHGVAN